MHLTLSNPQTPGIIAFNDTPTPDCLEKAVGQESPNHRGKSENAQVDRIRGL
jgi:hypothetical protein